MKKMVWLVGVVVGLGLLVAGGNFFLGEGDAANVQGWCCLKGAVVPAATMADCKEKGGQFAMTQAEAQRLYQTQAKCWCCANGAVTEEKPAVCKEKRGVCSPTKELADKRCMERLCWCCINGELKQVTEAECKRAGGACYATNELAAQRCQKKCYCCINGTIVETTPAMCKEKGGTCYWTKHDAARCQKAQ